MKKMKLHSIKLKITCWYTFVLTLVFIFVLGGIFMSSEIYSEEMIREELLDEVKDLEEEMMRYPEHFPRQDYVSYYDDGVLLSIYDENFQYINGVVPDNFSLDTPFTEKQIQTATRRNDTWFVCDNRITLPDGSDLWIRGIHSLSSVVLMIQRLRVLAGFAVPLLILFTAFMGYRIIMRALHPVTVITDTVNRITDSSDLSLRLPAAAGKNEFSSLSETFNKMLDHLEQQFLREQEFSSDAAHELRTPVSVILSHTEYALAELSLSPEARQEFACIQEKALQMSHLVSLLLNIARAESSGFHPSFEEVDLQIVAEAAADELLEKAEKKQIRVDVQNFMLPPVMQGNTELLSRLFINLIDNGIQYGHTGGYVRVSLEQRGANVRICVEDNGIGIPEDKLDKIWNRFYRAEASRSVSPGFGLGLFIVKYIVKCHGGSISVESRVGQGTSFQILLPLSQSSASA